MSDEDDPYTMERYPEKFQVTLGRQKHNARQIMRYAKTSGRYQDMFRAPLQKIKIDEILEKTGYVQHGGQLVTKSYATKLRKEAARELRRRQGKPVVEKKNRSAEINVTGTVENLTKKLADIVFDYCVISDDSEAEEYGHTVDIHETLRDMERLLKAGANPNGNDADFGDTPMIIRPADDGHEPVVKMLLDYGANPNARDPDSNDPALVTAIKRRHNGVAKVLIEKGANIEAPGNDGKTPLALAREKGSVSIVRLLLSKGANPLTVNTSPAAPRALPEIDAMITAAATIHRLNFFRR